VRLLKTGDEDIHLAQAQKLDTSAASCACSGRQASSTSAAAGARWCAGPPGTTRRGNRSDALPDQHRLANERIQADGLAGRCKVLLQDYRDVPGEAVYDKIASVGMFEHVGLKNLPLYFGAIRRLLKTAASS